MASTKAALTRGNQVLSGNNKDVSIDTKDSSKEESNIYVKTQTKDGIKDVDMIVVNTINALKAGRMGIKNAASIITGRIRVRFVNAIRRNKENSEFGYEITSFKYLDEILFNDLTYVLSSIFQWGSSGTLTLPQIMRMITDTSNVIEYYIPEEDLNDIRNILGVVYREF